MVGELPGTDPRAGYYVVCGHYDATAVRTANWNWRTDPAPGADDNATGAALVLEAARVLSTQRFPWSIRFIAFSGEELGLLGSQAYVKKHLKEIKDRLKLVVNIDVSGDAIGHDHFNVIGSKELLGYTDGITKEIGMVFKSAIEIFSSDGMPFTPYEIPSVNVFRAGGKATTMIHTQDLADWILFPEYLFRAAFGQNSLVRIRKDSGLLSRNHIQ